ncbi:MAG: FeoB-associated Cys-rich membrane protein [Ruminococcus sp.]|nr:FeoB-associated Cys-rich membrane protein [Ruminococcus sp.]
MPELLWENRGTIIAGTIVLLIIAGAVRSIIKNKRQGKGSCGCGCANCALNGKCYKSMDN